jgi:hypothetical protein
MPNVLFLADQFTDATRTEEEVHPGGAELTDEAAIEASPWPVDTETVDSITPDKLEDYDLHILGNLRHVRPETVNKLCSLGRHVLFEHDCRICHRRGNFPDMWERGHRDTLRCRCPHPFWQPLVQSSKGVIFLTHRQAQIYYENPYFQAPRSAILGSSLMNRAFLERVERYRDSDVDPSIGTVTVFSRVESKGSDTSLQWCREHDIDPFVIKDMQPDQVLDTFEQAERLVYLPTGIEWAGRVLLEARFLGCDVVYNANAGVCQESWWNLPDDTALQVLKDAPHRFWRLVERFHAEDPNPVETRRRAWHRWMNSAVNYIKGAFQRLPPWSLVFSKRRRHRNEKVRTTYVSRRNE